MTIDGTEAIQKLQNDFDFVWSLRKNLTSERSSAIIGALKERKTYVGITLTAESVRKRQTHREVGTQSHGSKGLRARIAGLPTQRCEDQQPGSTKNRVVCFLAEYAVPRVFSGQRPGRRTDHVAFRFLDDADPGVRGAHEGSKGMLRGLLRGERGSAMPMLVLSMTIVVGSMALTIDGGNAFLERRRLQNAADAAALAGAEALALGGSVGEAAGTATEFAVDHNGASSADITVDGGQDVTVVAHSTSPTIFGCVLGQLTFDAAARAGATYAAVGALHTGVFPIAVHQDVVGLDAGDVDILSGAGPGNFGWLGWTGCTETDCLCESLTYQGNSETYTNPYDDGDHLLSVGDWVDGSTGTANADCVRDALDTLIADGTPIFLPVWDQAQGTGDELQYRLNGFAKFVVTDYLLPGANRITGHFVRDVTPGVGVTTGSGFGVYRVMVTE
jgi:hypothetical protein